VAEIYNRETRKYRKRGCCSDNAKAFAAQREGAEHQRLARSNVIRAFFIANGFRLPASGCRRSARADVMIACLGGGIGAARLWRALVRTGVDDLVVIVNTADDLWRYGLRVCPDLDTVQYWLSDRADTERGWGLRGESFRCMDAMRGLGGAPWFALGDMDLATHLLRTAWLREGAGLGEATERLGAALGVPVRVLPMCEQEVATQVRLANGDWIGYQEFIVHRRADVPVEAVRWVGMGAATPAPGVLAAVHHADLIILGPSNPLASVRPILGVPGVVGALRATAAPVVAVTPVVSGIPIVDAGEASRARSRAALLGARGLRHRAAAVASLYRGIADVFVLDAADAAERDEIVDCAVVVTPTLVHLGLADELPELLGSIRAAHA
jgi:LPPG:FO 2-phospho-L-lactate transferase